MRQKINRSKQTGFTLIELMLIIGILAIVLAMAAPSLSQFVGSMRLRGVTDNLAQDLILARSEATRQNKTINFDLQGAPTNCYGLGVGCDCTETDEEKSEYCEIKRESGFGSISLTPAKDAFDSISFDAIRGMPVDKDGKPLAKTQTVSIENSATKKTVTMTVIGSVSISQP